MPFDVLHKYDIPTQVHGRRCEQPSFQQQLPHLTSSSLLLFKRGKNRIQWLHRWDLPPRKLLQNTVAFPRKCLASADSAAFFLPIHHVHRYIKRLYQSSMNLFYELRLSERQPPKIQCQLSGLEVGKEKRRAFAVDIGASA